MGYKKCIELLEEVLERWYEIDEGLKGEIEDEIISFHLKREEIK